MKKSVSLLTAALTLAASSAALAQQAPKPEQIIKWRQSVYQVLAWNQGRIKANVDGTYNKEEVLKSANTIAALANAGLGSLFPAGTESGKGWKETATRPEFFTNTKHAAELAGNFIREANELAKLAAAGDQAAVKAQHGKVGQACKACHDDFKVRD